MTKQNSKQSATHTTPDKTRSNKPLVPLTEAQLEAIAGGIGDIENGEDEGYPRWACGSNHNETLVNALNL